MSRAVVPAVLATGQRGTTVAETARGGSGETGLSESRVRRTHPERLGREHDQ